MNRDHVLPPVRVTLDERDEIRRQAASRGLGVSTWMRKAAIAGGESPQAEVRPLSEAEVERMTARPTLPASPAVNVPEAHQDSRLTCRNRNCQNFKTWFPLSPVRCPRCNQRAS